MSILFNFPNFIDGNIFIFTDWQCGFTSPRFIAHPWWFLWVTIKDLYSFSSWYMYLFLLYLQEFFIHKIKTSLSIFCLVVTMNKLILKALFFFTEDESTDISLWELTEEVVFSDVLAVVLVITNLACQTHTKIAYDLIFLSKPDLTSSCLISTKFCFYRMSQRT